MSGTNKAHTCKTECLFTRLISISEFARDRPLYPNRNGIMAGMYVWLKRSDTSTHPGSSLVQDWMGCLHPLPQNWKTEQFVNPLETGVDPTATHTHILPFLCHWEVLLQPTACTMVGSSEAGDRASAHHAWTAQWCLVCWRRFSH